MAYPIQSFGTISSLLSYINSEWITNGIQNITGITGNNVVNALAQFIIKYTLNSGLAQISSVNTGTVTLPAPVTVFTGNPTSVNWIDDVQNEYYIVNTTGFDIPIANGFGYLDNFGNVITNFPARLNIHIAKMSNGSWIRVNNIGSGGGSSLPPQPGHAGQVLFTNGTSAFWSDPTMIINGQDANWINPTTWVNGSSYNNTSFSSAFFTLFWNDANRYLLQNTSPTEWSYVANGFEVLYPGFNAQALNVNLFLVFKGTP